MFRFLLPILALSAVALGGVLPEASSDDLLYEENSDDFLREENNDDVFPGVIDSSVLPEGLEDLLSESISEDLLSEEDNDPNRIVGGSNTAITSVPWQLLMRRNNNFLCGAVLISPTWALSAAHCTQGAASAFTLVAGTANRLSGGQVRQVTRIINHPNYNARTIDNDICVMQVQSPFSLSNSVRTIGMPAQGANFNAGTYGTISGWGRTTEGGSSPTTLQSARIPVFNHATCRANYGGNTITNNMICAGHARGGRNTCQGDSGGPFAIGNQVVGITSFAVGCARPNFPTVFARVAIFRNWVRGHTGV